MREVCPDIMAAIEGVADDQATRENLINEVAIEVEACTSDGGEGTATNNSDLTVSVFIDVEFLDEGGVVVDSGSGSVSGLRPGETGRWDAVFIGDDYDRCRAEIDSVFED